MSTSAEMLRSYDNSALNNEQFVSSVSGKKQMVIKGGKSVKAFGAVGFLTLIIVITLIFFGTGNIIPSTISERLIEETDVQYADAVKSKEIVFQQAMRQGAIPDDTKELLAQDGVETEVAENGEVVLKMNNKIITADDFINEVNNDSALYSAFTKATYGRAAYYYDKSAMKVFREYGTNRNSFTSETSFNEVMETNLSQGSDISVNSVSLVKEVRKNSTTGEDEVYYRYIENGSPASSKASAGQFINETREKYPAASSLESALFTADSLKVADTASKENRSAIFFITFMENISKMKAGEGNKSKINEAMNFLYEKAENEVVDIKTGEVKKVNGTALDAPSLYAILSGNKIDASKVENYSSDRILKTIENQVGVDSSGSTISGTVASSSRTNSSIGRFVDSGAEKASADLINVVEPTVSSSLTNNSFETIKGINAGELLVEGAINVGKSLAKESGASAGDTEAVLKYIKMNNEVIAMDAKIDRENRSPFDITSKNTFLGSIIYNFAYHLRQSNNSALSGLSSLMNSTKSAALSLLPTTYADEETTNYLSSFGDCETYGTINAVGTAQCSEIATFDTSTLDDPYNDPGFVDFINKNTSINSLGERTINRGSDLATYILYNDERITPLGVIDGGIIESLKHNTSSISQIRSILQLVESSQEANEVEKTIASGAAFINSSSNPNWQTYKYAQRYVSLARATAALKQYSNDSTAYNKIQFFEGDSNPVMAFLDDYYTLADN